jgi:hypothetical protein
MAIWKVTKTQTGREMVYHNLQNDTKFNCGPIFPEVTDPQIVDWVVNAGSPLPGDVIIFETGEYVQFAPTLGLPV